MKRSLVINADDLGADEARNEGIFEAIDAGVVTSASLLANGPALEDALARMRALKNRKVSFGFHLNLSQGTPVSEGHRLLVGSDGNLAGNFAIQLSNFITWTVTSMFMSSRPLFQWPCGSRSATGSGG
ncbi:MAG: ChbG/HpnK family deacetylase [Deltaproteobacteria bacterium]|nr:ChbG/HpnK family deacetylase [Deltaproteobacteria bacterium]